MCRGTRRPWQSRAERRRGARADLEPPFAAGNLCLGHNGSPRQGASGTSSAALTQRIGVPAPLNVPGAQQLLSAEEALTCGSMRLTLDLSAIDLSPSVGCPALSAAVSSLSACDAHDFSFSPHEA